MSDAKTRIKEKTMSTHRFMFNDKQIFEQYEITTYVVSHGWLAPGEFQAPSSPGLDPKAADPVLELEARSPGIG